MRSPDSSDAAIESESAFDCAAAGAAMFFEAATDAEVVEYKRFVFALADTVAKAHKEGGFLGIGGTQVSEHEQAALDEIAAIFDEKQAG